MKFQTPILSVILLAASSESFAFQSNVRSMTSTTALTATPSAEDSARALTNYMAKAHEEKLRALKALELKKDAEIKVSSALSRNRNLFLILITSNILYKTFVYSSPSSLLSLGSERTNSFGVIHIQCCYTINSKIIRICRRIDYKTHILSKIYLELYCQSSRR